MDIKDVLEAYLIDEEELRLRPYRCTGAKLTIGVGRNLDDVGISEDEAKYLLRNDIDRAIMAVGLEFPWAAELNEARQLVLVDMAFNLGVGGLGKFKNFLAYLRSGDFERAADEMLDSRWAEQVGRRAQRLARIMRKGEIEWPL